MPDALGYQKINTLDEYKDMPSFLEGQVKNAETLQEKQKKQQEDNAAMIGGLLDTGAKDAYMFNDYYQKKFKDFRDMVIDKFSKNQNNPYNVLNDADVKKAQIDLMHTAEAGKTAQALIHEQQAKIRGYQSNGEMSADEAKKALSDIDGIKTQLEGSKDPVSEYFNNADIQNKLFEAGKKPEKPFEAADYIGKEVGKYMKPYTEYSYDGNKNLTGMTQKYTGNPVTTTNALFLNAETPNSNGNKLLATAGKEYNSLPQDKKDFYASNSQLEGQTGDPVKQFFMESYVEPMTAAKDKGVKPNYEQWRTQIAQQNANTYAAKQTGVTVTKDNHGVFNGIKGKSFDYNIDTANPSYVHVRPHSFTDETKYTYVNKDGKDVSGWVTGWNRATNELTIKTYDKSKWGTNEESIQVPANDNNMQQFASQGGDDHAEFIKNLQGNQSSTTPAAGGNDGTPQKKKLPGT